MQYLQQIGLGFLLFIGIAIAILAIVYLTRIIGEKTKKSSDLINRVENEKKESKFNTVIQIESGLEQPQGEWCNLILLDDSFKFCFGNNIFSLSKDKIVKIVVKSQRQLKEEYNSSASVSLFGSNLKTNFFSSSKKDNILFLIFEFTNKQNKKENIIFDITQNPSIDPLLEMLNLNRNIKDSENSDIEL